MAPQVHQQGTMGIPTTSRPIVHAKGGGRHHGRVWQLDETQQSIGAGGHMARGAQPCPGFAAKCETEWLRDDSQAHAALSRRPDQLRQTFSERLSRAGGIQATKAAKMQDQTHCVIPQRKIARAARVVAMDAWL
jgi:hypothetical protein